MQPKKIIYIFFILAVSALFLYNINKQETLLANGRTVYLKLAPVDPRSIMQGDYMILNYEITRNLDCKAQGEVLSVNEDNTAVWLAPFLGQAIEANQIVIKPVEKMRRCAPAPESFMFREGKDYSKAKYAKLKYADNGKLLLLNLTDESFNIL